MEDRVKELEAKVEALMYRVAALEARPIYQYTPYPYITWTSGCSHPQYEKQTLYGEIK